MKPNHLIFILAGFGILGCFFLGFVISLGNYVTNEYVDRSLPGTPVIQEYGFRIGGEYGFITLFLLLSGCVLAIGGNLTCIHILQQQKLPPENPSESNDRFTGKRVRNGPFMICQQCGKMLPADSKFCPKCGSTSFRLQGVPTRRIHKIGSIHSGACK